MRCYDCYEGSTIITFLGNAQDVLDVRTEILDENEHLILGYDVLPVIDVVDTRTETVDQIATSERSTYVEVEIPTQAPQDDDARTIFDEVVISFFKKRLIELN